MKKNFLIFKFFRFLSLFIFSVTFFSSSSFSKDENLCPKYLYNSVLDESLSLPHLEIEESSFAKKYPLVLESIKNLDQSVLKKYLEFSNNEKKTLSQATEFLDFLKDSTSNFKKVLKLVSKNTEFYYLLEESISNIQISEHTYKQMMQRLKSMSQSEFQEKVANFVSGFLAQIRGELGELEFLMHVKNFEKRRVNFSEFLDNLKNKKVTDLQGEIDVIFKTDNNKTVWVEIKNYQKPLTSHNNYLDKIIEQVKKLKLLRDLVDPNIEIRVYVKNGMSNKNKKKIENLGIKVY